MSLVPVSRSHVGVATALWIALVAPVAMAQTGAAAKGSAATGAAASPAGPLVIWVDTRDQAFDKARLQVSLAHELGREVVLAEDPAAAAVQISLDGAAHADVRYTTPGGEKLSRHVDLPPDRERAVQVVSWLTVNLVRDEASELLDELRARRKEEADARAAEQAAADKAVADKAVADKAVADKAAADKVAADKTAAEAARQKAEKDRQTAADRPRDDLLRDPLRSVDVAVATPLSFLHDSPKRELHLQLALGYGESGAIDGVGVSPGVLRVRRDLFGVTVGTAAVFVHGNARGVLVAAGYSQLDGTLDGVQLGAGVAVQSGAYARGAVVAVGGAVAGDVNGAVVGGGFATAKSLHGVGVSAGLTLIRGRSEGVLLGGGATSAADLRGIQIAAGVNIARDLDGIAFAPVNVHRRVKGIQFGLVNVAENVDGAAIGLLSFAKNGRVQPVLWGGIDGSVHVGIKSIAGLAFTQLGAGIDLAQSQLSYDAGVGLHLRLGQSFFFEPGVHYTGIHDAEDASGAPDEHQLHYVAQLGFRVGDKLDLLAGAGVRHTVSGGSGAAIAPDVRVGIAFF